jgi:hypothetical protein
MLRSAISGADNVLRITYTFLVSMRKHGVNPLCLSGATTPTRVGYEIRRSG